MKRFLEVYDFQKKNYEILNIDHIAAITLTDTDSSKGFKFLFNQYCYSDNREFLYEKTYYFLESEEREMFFYDQLSDRIGDLWQKF